MDWDYVLSLNAMDESFKRKFVRNNMRTFYGKKKSKRKARWKKAFYRKVCRDYVAVFNISFEGSDQE